LVFFFFSSRRRHTRWPRDWSSDVCSSDLEMEDSTIGWRFVNPRLAERYEPISLGETAENVAERYEVSRQRQDEMALASHQKATRSEERRVGKECRCRWTPDHEKEKKKSTQ